MEIIPVESGPFATNCYLVIDEVHKEGIIIDAPPECTDTLVALIEEREIKLLGIFLTHSHWDHIADASELRSRFNAPVYVHKDDEYRLIEPMRHTIIPIDFKFEFCKPDKYLIHKSIIKCGNLKFEVRHTPGHTEGGVCFVEHTKKVIFTGDTLFYGSVGRVDFPGGSMTQLIDSIKREILSLTDDFIAYCGHGESTTIGFERVNNYFLNEY